MYRVHLDGTGIEQLTEGPSYDDQAALSPDGRTLAFVSTRGAGTANIWLLDLAAHRYTNLTKNKSGNFRPSWSPDAQWIAFSSDRDTKPGRAAPSWELMQSIAIYIVHPDGTGLRRLTELGGYSGSPQWSADGRRIVFYQSTPSDAFHRRSGTSQIVSIDVERGALQTHTSGPGLAASPRYLAGQEIAYVVISRAASGDKQGLRYTSGRKGVLGRLRYPSWSADGKTMVYHKTFSDKVGVSPAFSLDPEFELFSTKAWMLNYSPDGQRLALSDVGGTNLKIMNDDGTSVHQVFASGGKVVAFPTWSPDGKSIVFGIGGVFERPAVPGQPELIRADGSNPRMLTDGKYSSGFASWSPDGRRLVYRVMRDGQQGLRILNLDDSKITTRVTVKGFLSFAAGKGRESKVHLIAAKVRKPCSELNPGLGPSL